MWGLACGSAKRHDASIAPIGTDTGGEAESGVEAEKDDAQNNYERRTGADKI
jgi:hypothetical protein